MHKIIALLFLLGVSSLEAKIITTDKIEDIEVEFAKADNETLIAFDCDEVLTESHDCIFRSHNRKILKTIIDDCMKSIKKHSPKAASEREIYAFYCSIAMRDSKAELLNKRWPLLITVLQSRGIKTILLSACGTGKFGVMESAQDWRYNQLTAFGIDFKKSWGNLSQITFFDLGNNHNVGYPIFYNGMLLSAASEKGDVLKAFLSKIPQYKFKKIIFIDDKLKNVKAVEKVANELGVEFIGIEYTYAKTKKHPPLNLEKVRKQFEILIEEKRWVSDEEMEKIK